MSDDADGRRASPPDRTGEDARPSIAKNYSAAAASLSTTTFRCVVTSLCSLMGIDELADDLERFVQLDLPAIDVEALLLERLGNVAGRDRSEQLIGFARLAQELHLEPVKLLGQRFGFRLFLGGAAHSGGLHLLDDSLVGDGGLNRQFLGQQKIPPVSLGDFHHLAAVAQLGHVFFQDDFHE